MSKAKHFRLRDKCNSVAFMLPDGSQVTITLTLLPPKPTSLVECRHCGNRIVAFHGRRYCSDSCRQKAFRRRDTARRGEKRAK